MISKITNSLGDVDHFAATTTKTFFAASVDLPSSDSAA